MPASVLPVKEIAAISVLEASLVPIMRPEPVKQLTAFLGTPASTSIPVSYTHLDVYKRQEEAIDIFIRVHSHRS